MELPIWWQVNSQGLPLLGQGLGHESYVLKNTVLRQQGMCWAKHTQFLLSKSINLITDLTYQRVKEVRRGKETRRVSLVEIFPQGRNRPEWGRSIFPAPGPLMKSDKVRAQTVRRRCWSRDSGALETRKGRVVIARERLSFMPLNLTLSIQEFLECDDCIFCCCMLIKFFLYDSQSFQSGSYTFF